MIYSYFELAFSTFLIVILSFSFFMWFITNVIPDHKTSLKFQFFEIEIYTSSESWINKLSIDV